MDNLLLRPTLFWDVNIDNLDPEKNAQFIVGRVLDFGNLKEWQMIKEYYGRSEIKKMAKNHVFFNQRNANFWSIILKIPLKELKCTRRPSLQTPKAFLR